MAPKASDYTMLSHFEAGPRTRSRTRKSPDSDIASWRAKVAFDLFSIFICLFYLHLSTFFYFTTKWKTLFMDAR